MGAFSEMDMLQGNDDPFMEADTAGCQPESHAAASAQQTISTIPAPAPQSKAPVPAVEKEEPSEVSAKAGANTEKCDVDEDAKRKAHEEAEAKRKADWQANKAAKKAAEKEQLARISIMSDDDVMMASVKRVAADTEKLTRRNMKECVSEHIQTKCLEDPDFARKTMHPRKSMIHCIWYINRKAQEFLLKEMELNGQKPEGNGIYGGDVPDETCYQWAEDYYNDPNAEEDKVKEEKFVPKPYNGKSAVKNTGSSAKKVSDNKTPIQQTASKKTESELKADSGQMTLEL